MRVVSVDGVENVVRSFYERLSACSEPRGNVRKQVVELKQGSERRRSERLLVGKGSDVDRQTRCDVVFDPSRVRLRARR